MQIIPIAGEKVAHAAFCKRQRPVVLFLKNNCLATTLRVFLPGNYLMLCFCESAWHHIYSFPHLLFQLAQGVKPEFADAVKLEPTVKVEPVSGTLKSEPIQFNQSMLPIKQEGGALQPMKAEAATPESSLGHWTAWNTSMKSVVG